MRSVGDAVAIVVGESEKAVDKALNMIKVKYTVLEPVLDFRKSLDNKVLVHPEDDWSSSIDTGDVKRNLIHHEEDEHGNVEKILSECDEIIEHTYRIKAAQQAYMETCRAYCEIDRYGRLHCISSTQIVFHLRRILANALDIPKSMVRAEKPRIGGGFGAKQTAVCEVYPAFVTWKTKRPSKIIYSRKECQTIASPRHEMEVTVRLGAMKDGHIRAIDLYTLSNGGAYGEHSTTTVDFPVINRFHFIQEAARQQDFRAMLCIQTCRRQEHTEAMEPHRAYLHLNQPSMSSQKSCI